MNYVLHEREIYIDLKGRLCAGWQAKVAKE